MIEPGDPFQGGECDGLPGFPSCAAVAVYQSGLVLAVKRPGVTRVTRNSLRQGINPNLMATNGGDEIRFALASARYSALHFSKGGIVEGNFSTYPLIGIADMPKIETVITPNERSLRALDRA